MVKYSSDEIFKILEQELISLEILPSEILSENALCSRFNVSRTIIRSALQRLEQSGFVEIIPCVGTRVTPINLNAVTEFMYLRIVTETAVLKDFIKNMTPPQLEEIRFHMETFEKAVKDAGNLSQLTPEKTSFLLKSDLEFHHCYFRFTGKPLVWDFLTQPHPNYSRFIRLDMMGGENIPDVLVEHRVLMDLLDSRNCEAFEEAVSRHLYGGIRRLGPKLYSEEYRKYFRDNTTQPL